METPKQVEYIISTLEANGHNAHAVGGCVRDSLLGGVPEDWDICTSALPYRIKECFKTHSVIETGLQHGTVTIILDSKPFEVTTYRIDGEYSDNRRPDNVEFTDNLRDDLSRRDFTINAMAYNPKTGIIDFFGGGDDLKSKIIRCVGNADKRFNEDALRIMRALRFASVLGFSVESDTAKAIRKNRKLLQNIAAERINAEFSKLVTGACASDLMYDFTPVIEEIIPEVSEMVDFNQNTKYHHLDVWRHTLLSVKNAPADTILRLTLLLHDVGKPRCYNETDGVGHFYGHAEVSVEMAKTILTRLKYDGRTIETVTKLVSTHDAQIVPQIKSVKRWLNKIGEDMLRLLIEVKRADNGAVAPEYQQERLNALREISALLDEIIEQKQCFSLKDLAVDGNDLIDIGIPRGREIGVMLNRLLDMVIDGKVTNDRDELIYIAKCM